MVQRVCRGQVAEARVSTCWGGNRCGLTQASTEKLLCPSRLYLSRFGGLHRNFGIFQWTTRWGRKLHRPARLRTVRSARFRPRVPYTGGMDAGENDQLLQQAMDGNQAALAELFELHRGRLTRLLELRIDRRVQGRVSTSDVLQEAYLDLADQLRNYQREQGFPFYLWLRNLTGQRLTMVHRKHLGAKKRAAGLEVSLNQPQFPAASSAYLASELVGQLSTASRQVIRAETHAKVQALLNDMDEADREIIALRHFEQLSNSEIALVLGVSVQAASNRYYRALRRVRDEMAKIPGMMDGV